MGCCGCNNRASATTAAIFGLIQGITFFGLVCYFLQVFYGNAITDQDRYLYLRTIEYREVIRGLLVTSAIFHAVWTLSSIVLLIGNTNNLVCCVRQWTVVTCVIIVTDVLFPAIFLGKTMGLIVHGSWKHVDHSDLKDVDEEWEYNKYVLLTISFSKLGIITLGINIALCIFTNRRVHEIKHPQANGYVIQPATTYGTGISQTGFVTPQGYPQPQAPQQQMFMQQGYVQHPGYNPQQQGYAQQGYNITQQGYNNPPQGYHNPQQAYNTSQQGYNTHQQGFNIPQPGYNTQQQDQAQPHVEAPPAYFPDKQSH